MRMLLDGLLLMMADCLRAFDWFQMRVQQCWRRPDLGGIEWQ